MSISKESFRERLAYYLMGVAIGCVVLGFAWNARKRAAMRTAPPPPPQQPAQPPGPAPQSP